MTFQEDSPHGPMCAQRFAPAAECTCGKADALATEERFWIIETPNESNRIEEVSRAANLHMVGLVDESYAGVIAYLTFEVAEELVVLLNRGEAI